MNATWVLALWSAFMVAFIHGQDDCLYLITMPHLRNQLHWTKIDANGKGLFESRSGWALERTTGS